MLARAWLRLVAPPIRRDVGVTIAFNLALALWIALKPSAGADVVVQGMLLVGAILGLGILLRGQTWPPRRSDATPLLLALAGVCVIAGQVLGALVNLGYLPDSAPTPGDVVGLFAYPVVLAAILCLPTRPVGPAARSRVVLDGLMILVAAQTLSWYFLLGPVLLRASGSPVATLVDAAFPLCDTLLLLSLLFLDAHAREPRLRPAITLLGSAITIMIATDSILGYQAIHGAALLSQTIVVGWPLGWMFGAVGARASRFASEGDVPPALADVRPIWRLALPYLFLPVVGALLFVAWWNDSPAPLVLGVAVGGAIFMVLVIVRQLLALVENRELYRLALEANAQLAAQSATDPVTELPNHRSLNALLDQEIDRSRRYGHYFGVLFLDLDHFKSLNDLYGHLEGDVALRETSRIVRGLLRASDVVGRWGGEEFLAILPETDLPQAADVAARLREGVARHSFGAHDGHLTVSIGVACYPDDGDTRDALVGTADRALAAAKRLGRDQVRTARDPWVSELATEAAPSREQVVLAGIVEALVAMLDARDGYTGRHTRAVADMAEQLAIALGMDPGTARLVSLAARLHDVGKIAVPEAILLKPAPLTEAEWRLVQASSATGAEVIERIPPLRALAPLIRAQHERWDGQGYPDHRAGDAIPLGARILAVADAYGAMISDRPYRKALSTDQARCELKRASGRQFDPAVVAALDQIVVGKDSLVS